MTFKIFKKNKQNPEIFTLEDNLKVPMLGPYLENRKAGKEKNSHACSFDAVPVNSFTVHHGGITEAQKQASNLKHSNRPSSCSSSLIDCYKMVRGFILLNPRV